MEKHYTIAQVVDMLSREYEDVTVSSLRFLEQEGLVTPERTAGGHRRYTQADVERVRFIKEMQKRFFPLTVIKEMLHHANHKKEKGEKLFFRPLYYDPSFVPLTRAELAQASGLDEARLAEMESLGMITSTPAGKYNKDDLQAAKTMKGLVGYKLEPGDLAFYMKHNKAMVEEEMRLMISKVMAERSMDELDIVALHMEELGDELRHILHAKLLRQAAHMLADQLRKQSGEKL